MKKKILVVLMCLAAMSATSDLRAESKHEFEYSVGAELTSAYLWRGARFAGLSFQPCAEMSYAGFTLGAWGNVGASDWKFTSDTYVVPELDVYLSYSIAGFTASLTHIYYFDSKYLNFNNAADNWTQTEAMLSYTVSERIPLTLSWYTQVGGRDNLYDYVDAEGNEYVDTDGSGEIEDAEITDWKRAFSTYVELSYDFSLPWELNLNAAVGVSPWRSFYSDYENKFVVNNLTLRLEREWDMDDVCSLSAFVQPMYGFSNSADFSGFNWAVGMGVWF